jgi:hypothetical protein
MFLSITIHGGHGTGPNIEPILHPIFTPLILLGKRNLQSLTLLLPLRHKGATAKLSYELVFADFLRLSLKFITLIESVNVRLHTIR